jgi:mRNA interferase RelE/StbE
MKFEFTKSYRKSFHKIKDPKTRQAIAVAVKSVIKADNQKEIQHLKKLTGFKTDYRIKVGNYRIGIRIIKEVVYFVVVAHRKDIYRIFP